MSLNEDEERYRFCCNSFHAERGAYFIAIGGTVLTTLSFLGGVAEMRVIDTLVPLLAIGVYVAIFFAQKRNEPRLYLPFLILMGIYIVVAALSAGLLIFFAAFHPLAIEHILGVHDRKNVTSFVVFAFNNAINDDSNSKIAEVRIAALSISAAFTAIAAFHGFLWRVVYLAYEYMKLGLSSLAGTDGVYYPHYNEV